MHLIPTQKEELLKDAFILVTAFLFFLVTRITFLIVFNDVSSRYFLPVYVPGIILLIGIVSLFGAHIGRSCKTSSSFGLRLLVIATVIGSVAYIIKTINIIARGNYGEVLRKELSDLELFQKKCIVIDTEGQMSRVLYNKRNNAVIENMRGVDKDLLLYTVLNIAEKHQEDINKDIPIYLLLSDKTNDAILENAQCYWDIVPFELIKTIHYKGREGHFYLWKPPVKWKPHPARMENASNLFASDQESIQRKKILWFGDELFCKDFQKIIASNFKEISSNSYWYDLARWGWRRIYTAPKGPWGDKNISIPAFFQNKYSQNSFSHIIFSFGFHDLYYLDLNVLPYTAHSMEAFKNVVKDLAKYYPQTQFAVVIPTLVKPQKPDDDVEFQAELLGYYRNEMIKTIVKLHETDNITIKVIDFEPTAPYSSKLFDTKEERYTDMSRSITEWLWDYPKAE